MTRQISLISFRETSFAVVIQETKAEVGALVQIARRRLAPRDLVSDGSRPGTLSPPVEQPGAC